MSQGFTNGNTETYIEYGGGKYYLFFKDCIGTVDRTHILAIVDKEEQIAFRSGRDGKTCTQNMLGVCNFHIRFTFVVAGWEGTTHDSKVLNQAIYSPAYNFLLPPNG